MYKSLYIAIVTLISFVAAIISAPPSYADGPITINAGTVIPLRMETSLSSRTSRVGDRFTATVLNNQSGAQSVPTGTKVEGYVSAVKRAERRSRGGIIAVSFDRLVLADGRSVPIDGSLTALDNKARERLEEFGQESEIEGGNKTRRAIVFIGVGASIGAVIGAVTDDGRGAAVGAGVGAVLGTIGVLLSRGEEAEVRPGAEFGMRVERAISIDLEGDDPSANFTRQEEEGQRYRGSINENKRRRADFEDAFTSVEMIQAAQRSLRDRSYYSKPINGRMNPATRKALRQFQRDVHLPVTGVLDQATAEALGITRNTAP
jgi:Putative peptidoglycan binding domain